MADEEIRYRITAETADAQRGLEDVTRAEKEMAQGADDVGESAKKAGEDAGGMGESVAGLSKAMIGAIASGAAFKELIESITQAAEKAVQAVTALGEASRGLSANVGGQTSEEITRRVTAIAGANRFGVEGRAQLLAATTRLTDLKPGLDTDQITATASQLATLQRATGVGGEAAAELVVAMIEGMDLSAAEAVDAATVSLNSGIDVGTLQELVMRGSAAGGTDLMAMLLGAREEGLLINKASGQLAPLLNALNRRDESGRRVDELRAAGITDDMTSAEAIMALQTSVASGRIGQAELSRAVGGFEYVQFLDPIFRSIESGAFDRARDAMANPMAAENAVSELIKNPNVALAERIAVAQLEMQVRREQSMMRGFGETYALNRQRFEDLPFPLSVAGRWMGVATDMASGATAEEEAMISQRAINNITGFPADQVHVHIGQQIINGDEPAARYDGRDQK